jgi:hypothetical protein
MNAPAQLTPDAFRSVIRSIEIVRMNGSGSASSAHYWAMWGRAHGQIALLQDVGIVGFEGAQLLSDLLSSAADFGGRPFPSPMNVGPLIHSWISKQRTQRQARGEF